MSDPLARWEAPHLARLRLICEAIGYGRQGTLPTTTPPYSIPFRDSAC